MYGILPLQMHTKMTPNASTTKFLVWLIINQAPELVDLINAITYPSQGLEIFMAPFDVPVHYMRPQISQNSERPNSSGGSN